MKIIDINRALTIIDNFSNTSILVVGDLMVDHYIYGVTSRISPEAPVPIVDVQNSKIFLGGSGNVINNIFELGGKVYATGLVGKDDISKVIFQEFERRKINTDGIIVDDTRQTTLKTRIISHNQQVARFDQETKKNVIPKITKKILQYIQSKKEEIDVIIISDYGKGTITKSLIEGIIKITLKTNIIVCADPKRIDLSFYNGVDVITPNHYEAEKCGLNFGEKTDIVKIGKILLSRMNFRSILITRGELGMSLFERKNKEIIHTYFPARVVDVSDVSGAGDTVIATFSLCLATDSTFLEAAEISNLAAGIVVSKLGTATVTNKELKAFLNKGDKNDII